MKILSSVLIVLVVTILSSLAYSIERKKTLLISDIDDTIKVSHVLNKFGVAARAGNVTVPFTGMSQLYQLIKNENPEDTKIVYLSNAPEEIIGIPAFEFVHQTFLDVNHFPAGDLVLREDLFDPNHKVVQIRKYLEAMKPDVVIFIGDNGERDAEIYHQINLEYQNKSIKMVSFIHQLYSSKKKSFIYNFLDGINSNEVGKKIAAEQVGYVTPIEIAIELNQQSLLSRSYLQWMIKNVMPTIVSENYFTLDAVGMSTFPSFVACDDFIWRWTLPTDVQVAVAPLRNKIKDICN
ncbi:MAG: phosphatase domain-containing protein [Pseudobdellovibrio sp.]